MSYSIPEIRKSLVALVGVALMVATAFGLVVPDVVTQETGAFIDAALGLLTALGVFHVPNAKPAPAALDKGALQAQILDLAARGFLTPEHAIEVLAGKPLEQPKPLAIGQDAPTPVVVNVPPPQVIQQ